MSLMFSQKTSMASWCWVTSLPNREFFFRPFLSSMITAEIPYLSIDLTANAKCSANPPLSKSSKYFTFINLVCLENFSENLILWFRELFDFFLKGFFFVIAQIILFNLNFFFASMDILKWPKWAGSNVPPSIPIFFFF